MLNKDTVSVDGLIRHVHWIAGTVIFSVDILENLVCRVEKGGDDIEKGKRIKFFGHYSCQDSVPAVHVQVANYEVYEEAEG